MLLDTGQHLYQFRTLLKSELSPKWRARGKLYDHGYTICFGVPAVLDIGKAKSLFNLPSKSPIYHSCCGCH